MSYRITIKMGNLLDEQDATFIVNPSNTRLILGSGVSLSFKRHCGLGLQKEMLQSLEEIPDTLKQGDVVLTSSANATNFTYALHAITMDYSVGLKYHEKMPTIKIIETALLNIQHYVLWYANAANRSVKLVLPLMGCGVGCLDKKEVIRLYKTFFSNEISCNCEVIIYGYMKEDYELLL